VAKRAATLSAAAHLQFSQSPTAKMCRAYYVCPSTSEVDKFAQSNAKESQ